MTKNIPTPMGFEIQMTLTLLIQMNFELVYIKIVILDA